MEVAFSHWSASWPVLIGYALVATGQLAGLRRMLAAALAPVQRAALSREAAIFHGGLLVVVLSLVSPVGYWADEYLWVHALQLLLVTLVGPGLIVLGAPWQAFRQLGRLALPPPPPSAAAAAAGRPVRVPFLVSRPMTAVIVSNAAWLCWQLPVLSDLAATNAAVALAEHVCYLAGGLLLWLQLISSRPVSLPTMPLRRVALLTGTVAVFTVAGMALVFGSGVVYPAYANAAHHVMTVLDDQQLSGAVLWMGSLPPLLVAGIALVLQWLGTEESADLSVGLDRLLVPRKNGWPSRPVIR
jgi:cytochrome c oxidase assembly factor CtaG